MVSDENVIYGIHAVKELLLNRSTEIDHIYIDKEKQSSQIFEILKICRKERLAYNLVPSIKINSVTGTTKHQGVAALCSAKKYCEIEELRETIAKKNSPALLVVAASVEDPQNLGTIIRSSVAFGVDGLLLERKNTAPLSAAAVKSSAGMIEHLCISRPKNLEGILKEFVKEGYKILGAFPETGVAPDKIDLKGPTIIIVGGENKGIPPYLQKVCTDNVTIPMSPLAQSLNVSAACATLLYECTRQRLNG